MQPSGEGWERGISAVSHREVLMDDDVVATTFTTFALLVDTDHEVTTLGDEHVEGPSFVKDVVDLVVATGSTAGIKTPNHSTRTTFDATVVLIELEGLEVKLRHKCLLSGCYATHAAPRRTQGAWH
jgi:hypothetical protein